MRALDGLAAEPYIYTISGQRIYLSHPESNPVGSIKLADVAHALARISRFTGHTAHRYSVASHCLMVSSLVPRELARAALLHDAAEAYLGDVSSPLKSLLPEYKELQSRWEAELALRWGGAATEHPAVKAADRLAYAIERRDLCPQWPVATEGVVEIPPNAPHCTTYADSPPRIAAWWLEVARFWGVPEVA